MHLIQPAHLALAAIRAYQRYISPRKGFSCAYRVIAGGDSCSAYGYRVIARHGLLVGLRLIRRRLRRCSDVYQLAVAAGNSFLQDQRGECDLACDGCDFPSDGCVDICGECDFDLGRRERRRSRNSSAGGN